MLEFCGLFLAAGEFPAVPARWPAVFAGFCSNVLKFLLFTGDSQWQQLMKK
jgi:hypothetical protein